MTITLPIPFNEKRTRSSELSDGTLIAKKFGVGLPHRLPAIHCFHVPTNIENCPSPPGGGRIFSEGLAG